MGMITIRDVLYSPVRGVKTSITYTWKIMCSMGSATISKIAIVRGGGGGGNGVNNNNNDDENQQLIVEELETNKLQEENLGRDGVLVNNNDEKQRMMMETNNKEENLGHGVVNNDDENKQLMMMKEMTGEEINKIIIAGGGGGETSDEQQIREKKGLTLWDMLGSAVGGVKTFVSNAFKSLHSLVSAAVSKISNTVEKLKVFIKDPEVREKIDRSLTLLVTNRVIYKEFLKFANSPGKAQAYKFLGSVFKFLLSTTNTPVRFKSTRRVLEQMLDDVMMKGLKVRDIICGMLVLSLLNGVWSLDNPA